MYEYVKVIIYHFGYFIKTFITTIHHDNNIIVTVLKIRLWHIDNFGNMF